MPWTFSAGLYLKSVQTCDESLDPSSWIHFELCSRSRCDTTETVASSVSQVWITFDAMIVFSGTVSEVCADLCHLWTEEKPCNKFRRGRLPSFAPDINVSMICYRIYLAFVLFSQSYRSLFILVYQLYEYAIIFMWAICVLVIWVEQRKVD